MGVQSDTLQKRPTNGTEHILALDGMRGIAVLMVVVFHFCQAFELRNSLLLRLSVWGQTGVDLFFVLSGFLITQILLQAKGTDHFLRNFYARRTLRIFPLYYFTLLSFYILLPSLGLRPWISWTQGVWYWIYLQNIVSTFHPSATSGPGHLWSLAVEEHFYLIWPVLVMCCSRKVLMRMVAGAICLALITRVLLPPNGAFFFTLARFDGLAIGAAVAIWRRSDPDLTRLERPSGWFLTVGGFSLICTQLFVSGLAVPIIQILKSTLIASVYASLIILAVRNQLGLFSKVLSSTLLGSVGKYSYAMYVLHPFVIYELRRSGLPLNLFVLVLALVLSYAVARLSWILIEQRFMLLKRHFTYGEVRPAYQTDSAANAQSLTLAVGNPYKA